MNAPLPSVVIVLASVLIQACNNGPDPGLFPGIEPAAFPWDGSLGTGGPGSTIAIAIDSNYLPAADDLERLDLYADRVTVRLHDPIVDNHDFATDVDVPLRSLITLGSPRTNRRSETDPGMWVTFAVFDLPSVAEMGDPSEANGSFPFFVEVQLEIDGVVAYTPKIEIVGARGSPTDPFGSSLGDVEGELSPPGLIRLRGKRGAAAGEDRFYPGQPDIGAIEFDLEYDTDCATALRAFAATEADGGAAMVGPPTATPGNREKVRVVLIDPNGIDLRFPLGGPGIPVDEELAGTGPFIDIAFEDPGQSCSFATLVGSIGVSDLRATDLNGDPVIDIAGAVNVDMDDPADPDATLRMYVVPPEGA